MRFRKTMGRLFTICEWIMKLAYLNFLWMAFTLGGLVVFGVMPATVSLFTIIRKWLMKESDFPIGKTFFACYRNEFKKSNRLGGWVFVSGAFFLFDFLFLRTLSGTLQFALLVPLLIISIFYIITLLYLFPVYVHFDLKNMDYIKYAFFIGVLNLPITLLILTVLSAIIFLIFYQPGLFPFFSAVSMAFVLMFGGNYSFKRMESRQKKAISV